MLDSFNYYDFYDGTLYLESFLILYPNIYRIELDHEEEKLILTFISTKTSGKREDDDLLEKFKRGVHSFQNLNYTFPRITKIELKSDAYVNRILVTRDVESLTPYEVKCMAELFQRFFPLESFFDYINQQSLLAYTSHDEMFYKHENFGFLANFKSLKLSRSSAGVKMDKLIKQIVSALNEEDANWDKDFNIEGEM